MRIVSQNGIYDFSYERCTLWVREYSIVATPIADPETEVVMAIYSSEEKVKKAIRKLHNQYSYLWKLEHLPSPTYFRDDPIIFSFPGEDEI